MKSELNYFKESFVNFVERCALFDLLPKDDGYELFVEDFYIDNIGILADIENFEIKPDFFSIPKKSNKEIHHFLEVSLPYLGEKIKEYSELDYITYETPVKRQLTLETIFSGLKPSGNNNGGYEDTPSALALSEFNPNV